MKVEDYIVGMRERGIDRGALEREMPADELKTIGGIEERRKGYKKCHLKTQHAHRLPDVELEDMSHLNPHGWLDRQASNKGKGRHRKQ